MYRTVTVQHPAAAQHGAIMAHGPVPVPHRNVSQASATVPISHHVVERVVERVVRVPYPVYVPVPAVARTPQAAIARHSNATAFQNMQRGQAVQQSAPRFVQQPVRRAVQQDAQQLVRPIAQRPPEQPARQAQPAFAYSGQPDPVREPRARTFQFVPPNPPNSIAALNPQAVKIATLESGGQVVRPQHIQDWILKSRTPTATAEAVSAVERLLSSPGGRFPARSSVPGRGYVGRHGA